MWQRFTERARKVVFYAQEEAGRLGENYVSTEHLLLGLVRENDNVAARILDRMRVSRERIQSEILRQVTRGEGRLGHDMQLTPRAKRVIDLAYDEARLLNNNYIGTEHILLGLISEGEGLAGRTLSKLGVDLERTRVEVTILQEGRKEDQPDAGDDAQKFVDLTGTEAEPQNVTTIKALSADGSIIRIAHAVIQQAIQHKASEIRLEPTPNGVRVSTRSDGKFQEMMTVPKPITEALVVRFKIMADMNVEQTQLPRRGASHPARRQGL